MTYPAVRPREAITLVVMAYAMALSMLDAPDAKFLALAVVTEHTQFLPTI